MCFTEEVTAYLQCSSDLKVWHSGFDSSEPSSYLMAYCHPVWFNGLLSSCMIETNLLSFVLFHVAQFPIEFSDYNFLLYSYQVASDLALEQLILSRTWSKYASGQIATSTGVFHSKKSLIGGFSSLEIFFLFPLSIALSGELFLSDQYRRLNASF